MVNSKAIYYESKNLAKLIDIHVLEGKVSIGKTKQFNFSSSKPHFLETENPIINLQTAVSWIISIGIAVYASNMIIFTPFVIFPFVIWFIFRNSKKLQPFYYMKHNIDKPLISKIIKDNKKPEFNLIMTPESYKKLSETKLFENLVTAGKETIKFMILYIVIGAVMGFLLGQLINISTFK